MYGREPEDKLMMSLIAQIREFAQKVADAVVPGTFLVELMPAMLYLPAWMARWKREGLAWYRQHTDMLESLSTDT